MRSQAILGGKHPHGYPPSPRGGFAGYGSAVLPGPIPVVLVATVGCGVAGWALLSGSDYGFAAAIVLMASALWIVHRDAWQVALVGTLVTLQISSGSLATQGSALYELTSVGRVVMAATLAILSWRQASPNGPLAGNQKALLAGLYATFALALASTLWSIDPAMTLVQSTVLLLLILVVHGVVRGRWRDARQCTDDLRVAGTVMFGALLVGLVGFASGQDWAASVGQRMQGAYGNPNTLAMAAALSLFLGTGLAASRASRRGVLLPLALISCSVASLVLTATRTALLAVAIACLYLIVRTGVRAIVRTAIAAGLFWIVVTALRVDFSRLTLTDRFSAGVNPVGQGQDALGGRTQLWEQALRIFRENTFGLGWRVSEVALLDHLSWISRGNPHSSYLLLLVELGILAVVPMALLVASVVYIAMRSPGSGLPPHLAALAVAGLVICAAESGLFGIGQQFSWLLWLSVAALTTFYPQDQGSWGADPPGRYRTVSHRVSEATPR